MQALKPLQIIFNIHSVVITVEYGTVQDDFLMKGR